MKKFWKNFNLLGVLMLGLCMILGVGDLSGAITADAAATDIATNGDATASPNNEKGTMLSAGERSALATWDYRKWAPDLIKDPVEREVIQCRSYATPLDTILSYIGSEKINNLQFKYWQIGDGTLEDTVLLFECPGNTNQEKVIGYLYLDGSHTNTVHANDNLLVDGVVDANSENLYLFVQKVEYGVEKTISGSTVTTVKLTVTADSEQVAKAAGESVYKIPTIAADTKIYVCGNAHNELDVTSADLEFVPVEKKGYAQIFKREITISNYAQMADKEFKWDLNEIERETVFRWKKEKELAFLFGKMSKVYDASGHEVLRTAGIFRTILRWQKDHPNAELTAASKYSTNGAILINSKASKPADEFIDMMKAVFVGNNGNTERFAMAGPTAIARLSKMMAAGIQKTQDADKTDMVAGITFTKIVSKFGTLNLISHPLIEETPFKEYIMVIDTQFLKKKEVLPVDRQEVDGREHLIVNGKIVILSETSGVAVYNPAAHAVLKITA